MKLFGFLIVRERDGYVLIQQKNLDKIHQRNRDLDADNKSLTAQVGQLEERIEAFKVKTSRVNLSDLENRARNAELKVRLQAGIIKRMTEALPDENTMHCIELQSTQVSEPGLLPPPLVPASVQPAPGDTAIVLEPQPSELHNGTLSADTGGDTITE